MEIKSLCQALEYKLSCGGCCIVDTYENRESLIKELRDNTQRYRNFIKSDPSLPEKSLFFNRGENIDNPSGLCTLLVFLNKNENIIGCSAHPFQNGGIDFRKEYNICYYPYTCKLSKRFAQLPEEQQKRVLSLLQGSYGNNWFEFSIDMEKGIVEKNIR